MSTIQLEGTAKTPRVAFHDSPLSMEISGRSIPENSIAFYTPLLEWVDEHLKAGGTVDVSIRLEYFNTSSSKCLMDLLKRVEQSAAEATVCGTMRKMMKTCWKPAKTTMRSSICLSA